MKDALDLVLLAALWGASFLFMRMSVADFGAVVMIFVRVAIAGLFLIPFLFWKKRQQALWDNVLPIAVVGLFGSAIPFCLLAYSTLYVTAGFASILNAATPMFAAFIGFIWLKQRLSTLAVTGLFIGLLGVVLLVWDKIDFAQGGARLAILAGLAGAFCYGIAANFTKRYLAGVNALAITTGSLIAAGLMLLPFAVSWWPKSSPQLSSWINVLILAIFCTGIAQIIYFRLIERTSTATATTVTFMIPMFGILWGSMFLQEYLELKTLGACLVILFGTGLTTGIIRKKVNKEHKVVANETRHI